EPIEESYYLRELPELFTSVAHLEPHEHPFPVPYVERMVTMLIQPAMFLRRIRADFYRAGGKFVITTQLNQQSLIYEVDPDKYIVTKSRLVDAEGKTILLKEYRRLRKIKGLVLPQIIKLTRPQARERITVYYTSQKVNKKIAAEKFKIKPAKNAKRVYWGDKKRPVIDRDLQKANPN
ncbi:DUF4292 domain-containing protein, partial [candidate division KSB1 bacterium]|nr:DUF4292 domain-containing protein [candidate division KSB1 bacterium]